MVLDAVLSAFINSFNPQSYLWIHIMIIIHLLKIMKQGHREVKWLAQDHTAGLVRPEPGFPPKILGLVSVLLSIRLLCLF